MALVFKTGKLSEGMTYRMRDGQSGAGMLSGWGQPAPVRSVQANYAGVLAGGHVDNGPRFVRICEPPRAREAFRLLRAATRAARAS